MPQQLTLKEFGASVKAKYPEYAKYGDEEIASRMLDKYPQYKERIKVEAPTPKTPTTPPTAGEHVLRTLQANPSLNAVVGIGQGIGELAQTGNQWMTDLPRQMWDILTGKQNPFSTTNSMEASPAKISGGLTTSTGRDVFEPQNTAQKVGKIAGQTAATVAGGLAAGPTLPAQIAVGGMTGALAAPENPYPAAIGGMASPVVAKGLEKILPLAKALMSGRAAGGEKFGQIAAKVGAEPVDTWQAGNAALEADLLSKSGGNAPKVMRDFWKWEGPMDYDTARRFANRAGALTVAERLETDPAMKSTVGKLYAALREANREAAVKVGMGEVYDQAMREYRLGSKGIEIKDALAKALSDHGVKAAVGAGAGYGAYKALTK